MDNILKIPVKSFTSNDTYYVTIFVNRNDQFDANCTCGLKFNVGVRNKCKHIAYCVSNLIDPMMKQNKLEFDFCKMKI